jgi:hypothetical protein
MKPKTIPISRRQMLVRGAAVIAGLGATLVVRPVFAKAAKSDFQYQDRPHAGQDCAACKHYSPAGNAKTGTCAIVEGTVSAEGWCQAFSQKT